MNRLKRVSQSNRRSLMGKRIGIVQLFHPCSELLVVHFYPDFIETRPQDEVVWVKHRPFTVIRTFILRKAGLIHHRLST